jgi:hypothetical protein
MKILVWNEWKLIFYGVQALNWLVPSATIMGEIARIFKMIVDSSSEPL